MLFISASHSATLRKLHYITLQALSRRSYPVHQLKFSQFGEAAAKL
uniref:Uncharacterized protein n=1 Tax=Anguilla anguilla TaxID=7936 RepID=A0A0E9XTH3_ANGAN